MKDIIKSFIKGACLSSFLIFLLDVSISILVKDMSQIEAVKNNILPLIFSIYCLLAMYVINKK